MPVIDDIAEPNLHGRPASTRSTTSTVPNPPFSAAEQFLFKLLMSHSPATRFQQWMVETKKAWVRTGDLAADLAAGDALWRQYDSFMVRGERFLDEQKRTKETKRKKP